ncbi:MAG: ATP-binding protein [Candidatus Berkelbacteria bacterium]
MPQAKLTFKDRASRFYALLLFFLIPVLIITNSLWRISVYQKNMSLELAQKIRLTANVLASSINVSIQDPASLQKRIEEIKKDNTEIIDISILKSTSTSFPIIATTNQDNLGVNMSDSDFVKVSVENQTLVKPFVDRTNHANNRSWLGVAPLRDDSGNITGILALQMNTTETDMLNKVAINQSLILLVFTVFVVFLLLVNYFRFFEYFVNYKKIQEIDKLKDEFISMVSHELKTPLATVKGYLDMMLQGLTGKIDEKAKEHLLKIFANVQRLDVLINELLDVSRLEQDRMQFDMQPVNMKQVMDDVLTEISDQAKNKGLTIEHTPPAQLPPVFADPDRLHQIFTNIIGNAIKYTTEGGITILYSLDNGQVRITIKDTGLGMSKEDQKRLFERFYRIKNEKTADISGTGLGLWISKAIAKRMNGDIEVKSQENVGSEFTLVLPFIKEKK